MTEVSSEFQPFDAVAGVATAGIAHGLMLAESLNLPFAYVRAKAKGHGRQNLIEGELNAGSRVLVVEDLISTGGSCLAAVEALRNNGIQVAGVLAIFSYNFEKAAKAFKAAECTYRTLSNYDVLLREALASKYINLIDVDNLATWKDKVGR